MSDHPCPECGSDPTEESLTEQHLSDLGYLHDDRFLVCSECDNQWTVGLPRGTVDSDRWVCDACGGDFIPHFGYIHCDDGVMKIRPKCKSCKWVPDDPICVEITGGGNHDGRVHFKHHTVTGELTDNIPHE